MRLKDIKDLLLIALFGFIYYALVIGFSGNLYSTPVLGYFIAPILVPFLLGFAIQYSEQILEWPLAFLFGGAFASIVLVTLLSALGASISAPQFAIVIRNTIFWFGLMSALWIVALIFGFTIHRTFQMIVGSLLR